MRTDKIASIIPQAYQQGLLKPIRKPNVCLTDSLNQANFLLWLLEEADGNGLSTSQITQRSGLHENTCKCYLREFVKIGLVQKQKQYQDEAVWYLFQHLNRNKLSNEICNFR
ncbi:hypothetical protein IQ243_25420 [Nostocales cyanobacterium LEGE 11386]|nr:hypothetical protein [Nostocales cyanobacterium LEGE 11386]